MNKENAFRKFRQESEKAIRIAANLQKKFDEIQEAASNLSMPISKRAAKVQDLNLPGEKQKYLEVLGKECFESAKNLMVDYFRKENFCDHEIEYAKRNF